MKRIKPGLIKFLQLIFNLLINFGIHPSNWKIANIIMLHVAGKRKDLVELWTSWFYFLPR